MLNRSFARAAEHDHNHDSASKVVVRSDPSAIQFLQQNQAVAATLDRSTIAVLPEVAGERSVLAHEYAHIAQLRSGLSASREQSERAAEAAGEGRAASTGGAASPPLFKRASTITYPPDARFLPGQAREQAEHRELGRLGPEARATGTVSDAITKTPTDASSRIEVSASGPDGSIASSTEFLLHFDFAGVAFPIGGRPQINAEMPPVWVEYKRSMHVVDASKRKVDVRIHGLVACDYATWQQQTAGKVPSFTALMAIAGTKHFAGFEINGAGPTQSYFAFFSNHAASIAAQTEAAEYGLTAATPSFPGSDVAARFVMPEATAAEQFTSLEAFLDSADARERATRTHGAPKSAGKTLPPARHADQQPAGRLGPPEETVTDATPERDTEQEQEQERDEEGGALAAFFSAIADALSRFWDSLPWWAQATLEVAGTLLAAAVAVAILAEVIVDVVALAGIELAVASVAKVIGLLWVSTVFATSLKSRKAEAEEAGIDSPGRVLAAAFLDALGIGAVIEAGTDRSLLSHKELGRSKEERLRSGLLGGIQALTILGGMLKWGGSGAGSAPSGSSSAPRAGFRAALDSLVARIKGAFEGAADLVNRPATAGGPDAPGFFSTSGGGGSRIPPFKSKFTLDDIRDVLKDLTKSPDDPVPEDYEAPEGPDTSSKHKDPWSYEPDRIADSGTLAENLEMAGDPKPGEGFEAHHIVSGSEPAAARLRAMLWDNQIGINDAGNGVWLPRRAGTANLDLSTRHEFTFADHPEYFVRLNRDLLPLQNAGKDAILARIAQIKALLKDAQYP